MSVRVGGSMSATQTVSQKLIFCGDEHGKLVHFRLQYIRILTNIFLITPDDPILTEHLKEEIINNFLIKEFLT